MHVYLGECRHCDGLLIEGFQGRWDEDQYPAGCTDCDGVETLISYFGEISEGTFKDLRVEENVR